MFLRSAISVPAIFLLAYLLQAQASLADLRISLPYLIVNGILLLGLAKSSGLKEYIEYQLLKRLRLVALHPF